jgi:hypothetical protein
MMGGLLLVAPFSQLEKETTVTFLNVGQGDAILISQGRSQVLIDGGRSGKELLGRLGRHVPFWDRQIEYSHRDSPRCRSYWRIYPLCSVRIVLEQF